jgi:hypothetical protein
MSAALTTSVPYNEKTLLDQYRCILNSGMFNSKCNYHHAQCVSLTAIELNGIEANMTKENVKRALQSANEVFLELRKVAHINAKPNDDHLLPSALKRLTACAEIYTAVFRETGIKARSVPSYEFLSLAQYETQASASASAAAGKK